MILRCVLVLQAIRIVAGIMRPSSVAATENLPEAEAAGGARHTSQTVQDIFWVLRGSYTNNSSVYLTN